MALRTTSMPTPRPDRSVTASAVEQSKSGKTGIYDVVVTNAEGKKIALMRGKSHQLKGDVIPTQAA